MSTAAAALPPATSARTPTAASAAWTLSRVEGLRLLTHPLFVFGIAYALPHRWTLIAAPADDAAAQQRWSMLLALALLTLIWASRDPACRGSADPRTRR